MTDKEFEELQQEHQSLYSSFSVSSFRLHEETIRRYGVDPDEKDIYVSMAHTFAYFCMMQTFEKDMNSQKAIVFFMCMIDQFIGLIKETQGVDLTDQFKTAFKSLDKFLDTVNKKGLRSDNT